MNFVTKVTLVTYRYKLMDTITFPIGGCPDLNYRGKTANINRMSFGEFAAVKRWLSTEGLVRLGGII
jgi:hypothetical protein